MSVLLDSVILIDHLNDIEAATGFLRATGPSAFISTITRAEVLAGYDDEAKALPQALLDRYRFLPLQAADADLAASLRRRHRWKLPDAFQAALALRYGLKLATRNTRDFPPERHRFVVVPYTLGG